MKRCIIVRSCDLQKEHRGEITFPNLKSNLFTNRILRKSLYWNIHAFPSKGHYELENLFFSS